MLETGVDIVEIDRVAALVRRYGERFRDRVYTRREWADCAGRAESLAARFAAKEATMKALGVGLGAFAFHDVEVVKAPSGAPSLALRGAAAELAKRRGVHDFRLSISHTDLIAEAVVAAV